MNRVDPGVGFSRRPYVLVAGVLTAGLLLLVCVIGPATALPADRDQEIVGWVENVLLLAPDIHLEAKLDTGAETSSLDVDVLKKFRKDGKRWVRFRIQDRDTGAEHILVRERVRSVAIVQHNGQRQARPVVQMKICIAGRILETEVSLIDRSEFSYPLLLGRNSLASFALIDPGTTHLSSPHCVAEQPNGSSSL